MTNNHNIKNILFPTDFSLVAEFALRTAIAMCKRHHAKLHILNVVEVRFSTGPREAMSQAVYMLTGLEELAEKKLAVLVSEIQASHAIDVEAYVDNGSPATAITEKAVSLRCDLIVMGTHGASGIREFFLGSNAYAVIKNTIVPVLAIPSEREFRDFKKIIFPVRATIGVTKKFEFLIPVIEKNNAEIIVTALSLREEVFSRQDLDDSIRELAEKLKNKGIAFRVYFYVCDNYAKKVLDIAKKTKADLIAINATLDYHWKEFFIGPYTQQLVNHSKIPVLSFPILDEREAV